MVDTVEVVAAGFVDAAAEAAAAMGVKSTTNVVSGVVEGSLAEVVGAVGAGMVG